MKTVSNSNTKYLTEEIFAHMRELMANFHEYGKDATDPSITAEPSMISSLPMQEELRRILINRKNDLVRQKDRLKEVQMKKNLDGFRDTTAEWDGNVFVLRMPLRAWRYGLEGTARERLMHEGEEDWQTREVGIVDEEEFKRHVLRLVEETYRGGGAQGVGLSLLHEWADSIIEEALEDSRLTSWNTDE